MATDARIKLVKSARQQRRFLNKDFAAFRAALRRDAKMFFPDKIEDFSETGVGGMLIDTVAFVGDALSFFLDHQFGELFSDTAVENDNIERAIRNAGVEIVGAAPAVAVVTFFVEVPSERLTNGYEPATAALPVIQEGTIVTADNGVQFALTEDLDYAAKFPSGSPKASRKIGAVRSDGTPATYVLSLDGLCVSGRLSKETVRIPDAFVPFRKIVLPDQDVTEIASVFDDLGNTYYEVGSLTQDAVFKRTLNSGSDSSLVPDVLELILAPYRFTRTVDLTSRLTTLTFGGGNASTLDDDVIIDPSEFAVPLFGKKTFSRFTIDPSKLLRTNTLGIIATNTTLTVIYRHGGGLSHNVSEGSISNVTTLLMKFDGGPGATTAQSVRASTEATNARPASGGDDAPTIDELRTRIPAARNAQSRIVTREDLLARVYTMPANFGRVFRAGIRPSPINPLASQLFIISRDADQRLVVSPDMLKKNLARYLNEFRMVSDSIDILDVRVINVALDFEIVVDVSFNRRAIVQAVIAKLRTFFDIKNWQIDQPIVLSDIHNTIYNTHGVLSIEKLRIRNVHGFVNRRQYGEEFDVNANTIKGMIVGPPGSMFELRYSSDDIRGAAI